MMEYEKNQETQAEENLSLQSSEGHAHDRDGQVPAHDHEDHLHSHDHDEQDHEHPHSHEHDEYDHEHPHDHDHSHPHEHEHPHTHGAHSHVHDPKEVKRQLNRLARIIGHMEHIRKMIEADADCSDVLVQLSAVKSALNGLGKEIISEHLSHCITDALAQGDTEALDEFNKAIQQFL